MSKNKSFANNLSWVFIGNLLHAVASFLLNIFVARVLTTSDFGIINYAAAWIALFNSISSLGFNSIINKFTNDDFEKSNSYLSTAIIGRCFTSLIGIVATVITVLIINKGDSTVLWISIIQALVITFGVGDTLVFWFRYRKEANVVAVLRLIAFAASAIIRIASITIYKSIYLYIVGVIFETLVFSILLFHQYRKKYSRKIIFSSRIFRELLNNSYPFIFSSILATIYAQTDKIMLQNYLGNDEVAFYSVAVTVAGMMSIVVSALIEGFRPEIFACLNNCNTKKYRKRLSQLYAVIFYICILYGLFITIFSKQVLWIIYGEKYLPAVSALALVVWYSSFAYFGTVNNIYMVIEHKQKWVQITTLVGAVANIIMNAVLIPIMGIMGAALASLLTQIFANFVMLFIIPDLRPLVPIMIKGILIKDVFDTKGLIATIKRKLRK